MHDDPIAFFLTWTCYGTHLPGDERGGSKQQRGEQLPRPLLQTWCTEQMAEDAVILSDTQRQIVEQAIRDHSIFRKWSLHAVNCRSNHCHVVVSALNAKPELVRYQLKAWSTRRLNEHQRNANAPARQQWWTRGGCDCQVFDQDSLYSVIAYTLETQEKGGSKADY